jgi:hypothetical protein
MSATKGVNREGVNEIKDERDIASAGAALLQPKE